MSKNKQYTVSSNLELLHSIFNSVPVRPYCDLSDIELCALVHQSSSRNSVRSELLRRHAPLIATLVIRYYRRGIGGAELCDYESLAIAIALQSYDDYDSSRNASPSSYMFGLVLRRLLDAQRRTSLESDCRWPILKFNFRAWLNGDYDKYPELRERFEVEHGVTDSDRSEMRLLYGHLLSGSSVYVAAGSLDESREHGSSHYDGYSFLEDPNVVTDDAIVNRIMLDKVFAGLSETDRSIFSLFVFDSYSMVDISKELNIPVTDVRKRIKQTQEYCRMAMGV